MARVITMGGFDMFHVGHLSLLKACEKIAGPEGELHVGVNSDYFMASYKRRPIISWEDRVAIVRAVVPSAYIFSVTQHDSSSHLAPNPAKSPFDFLVIGEDWAHKDYFKQIGVTRADLKEWGTTLLYKHVDEDITTSEIIAQIVKDHK